MIGTQAQRGRLGGHQTGTPFDAGLRSLLSTIREKGRDPSRTLDEVGPRTTRARKFHGRQQSVFAIKSRLMPGTGFQKRRSQVKGNVWVVPAASRAASATCTGLAWGRSAPSLGRRRPTTWSAVSCPVRPGRDLGVERPPNLPAARPATNCTRTGRAPPEANPLVRVRPVGGGDGPSSAAAGRLRYVRKVSDTIRTNVNAVLAGIKSPEDAIAEIEAGLQRIMR